MKKFINKTALFIVPILVPLVLIELLIRGIPNDYVLKRNIIEEKASETEILIFGNSHAHLGLNPKLIDYQTLNMSHLGEPIEYNYYMFQKFAPLAENLRLIILPLSYFSLFTSQMSKKLVKNYSIYYSMDISDFPVDNLEILNIRGEKLLDDLANYYINHQDSVYLSSDTLGWYIKHEERVNNFDELARKAISRHTARNFEPLKKNYGFLKEIMEECKTRDVKVLFITTPHHVEYRNLINEAQWSLTQMKINELVKSYEYVYYLDFFSDDRFYDSDFKDADHLSQLGANKLSKLVNDKIKEIID